MDKHKLAFFPEEDWEKEYEEYVEKVLGVEYPQGIKSPHILRAKFRKNNGKDLRWKRAPQTSSQSGPPPRSILKYKNPQQGAAKSRITYKEPPVEGNEDRATVPRTRRILSERADKIFTPITRK